MPRPVPSVVSPSVDGMTQTPETQTDELLRVLGDGRWHRSSDLYASLNMVVHSIISRARKQGHVIEIDRRGNGAANIYYRLVRQPAGVDSAA